MCSWVRTGHIFKCWWFMNYAILKAPKKNCKWKKSVLLYIARWKGISIVRVTPRAGVGINWANVRKMHVTQRHSIKTIAIKNIFKLLLYNWKKIKKYISNTVQKREFKGNQTMSTLYCICRNWKTKASPWPYFFTSCRSAQGNHAFHC